MRFIAVDDTDGERVYLTNRRATGVLHENRTTWSPDINQARIFNNKGSATNSARQSGCPAGRFKILPVKIEVIG